MKSNKFMNVAQKFAGNVDIDANVQMVHRDKDGNVKPIFQDYSFTIWMLKKGLLSPLWINTAIGKLFQPFLGFWSTEKYGRNGVTTVGKAAVAGLINAVGGVAAFASIGQGTGTTAFSAADTILQTEVTANGTGASGVHVIAAATASLVTTTTTNDTSQLVGTVNETATIAVTESGVFNATTNGTLLARQTFTAINVVSGDSIQFTWKIKAA
jgi:hypothetical protein